jgi:hypothetical protein
MTNEPKAAPQAPAIDAAKQADKSATETKPIVAVAPVETPPADVKKT